MYANLKIEVAGETLFAHEVTIGPHGVIAQLDAQDGAGKYPEPNGERQFASTEPMTITADF